MVRICQGDADDVQQTKGAILSDNIAGNDVRQTAWLTCFNAGTDQHKLL